MGRSRYDGLNINYRRRLRKNFTVNASYTLSKAVAYNGNAAAFRNRAFNPFTLFDPTEFGPTPTDTRHRLSMSGVLNLPHGFQIAPILQAETARPYTAGYGTLDVIGAGSGAGTSHIIVFNDKKDDLLATFTSFGTNTALYRNCLRAAQCSILPFSNRRGQAFIQFDTRVTKNFRIKERSTLSLIFQVFDLTNRANFGNNFGTNVRVPLTFGKPINFITPTGVIVPHSLSAELGIRFAF